MAQNRLERQLLAGIRAARQGNAERARELLEGVLRQDRTNEQAWIFLASVVTSERERRMSLERIVRINPNNAPAQQALNDMVGVLGEGAGDIDVEAMSQAARTPIPSGASSGGGNARGNARPTAQNQGGGNNLFAILAVVAVILGLAFLGLIFAPQFLTTAPEPTLVAETTEEPTETVDPLFTPDTATPIPTSTFSGVFVTVERDATLPPTFTPIPSLTPTITPTATATLPPREDYSFLILGVQGVAEPAVYRLNGDGAGLLPIIANVVEFDFNPNTGVVVYTQEDSFLLPTETPTPTPVITDTPAPTPTPAAFNTPIPPINTTPVGGGGLVLSATSNEVVVSRMFITNIDNLSDVTEITTDVFRSAGSPALSPDGEWLAISSDRDGDEDLYLYNLNTRRFTQVTNNTVFVDTDPEWSPDGTTLIFASDRDRAGSTDIYTLDPFVDNPDGSVNRITDSRSANREPQFAPDGESITYLSIVGNETTVRVININGQAVQSLTFAPNLRYSPPAWTGDGVYVMYSEADGEQPSSGLVLQNPASGDILTVRVDNLDVLSVVSREPASVPSAQVSEDEADTGDNGDEASEAEVDEASEDTEDTEEDETDASEGDTDAEDESDEGSEDEDEAGE